MEKCTEQIKIIEDFKPFIDKIKNNIVLDITDDIYKNFQLDYDFTNLPDENLTNLGALDSDQLDLLDAFSNYDDNDILRDIDFNDDDDPFQLGLFLGDESNNFEGIDFDDDMNIDEDEKKKRGWGLNLLKLERKANLEH
jgi:hypothetical protein